VFIREDVASKIWACPLGPCECHSFIFAPLGVARRCPHRAGPRLPIRATPPACKARKPAYASLEQLA